MCGISAYISNKDNESNLISSLESIVHRGPDFTDFIIKKNKDKKGKTQYIGLGHVRLSIVDLSVNGNQPMVSKNKKYIMIYNGELYNTEFLKSKLGNVTLKSTSDSEVLLEYFSIYGVKGFNDLRGMFAAIFYNTVNGEIIALRDHLGIKPLYYSENKEELFLSSEIKGLRHFVKNKFTLCPKSLYDFMNLGFMYEPLTGFIEVKKVPPGSYLLYSNNKLKLKNYFRLNNNYKNFNIQKKSYSEHIQSTTISDAKLGVFFSGGIDSSIIAQIVKKDLFFVNTFTKKVKLESSDQFYASKIAQKLDLPFLEVDGTDAKFSNSFLENIVDVVKGNEELISDYTYSSSKIISKEARKQGFKVMLSGMGADEVYCGYSRHKILKYPIIYKTLRKKIIFSFLQLLIKAMRLKNPSIYRFLSFLEEKVFCISYARLIGYFSGNEIIKLLKIYNHNDLKDDFINRSEKIYGKFNNSNDLIKAFLLESEGFLTHNLIVSDKSSMAEGVELRVPFVSPDIFINNLREFTKNNEKEIINKKILKKYLEKYIPKKWIYRKKQGFNPPLYEKIMCLGENKIINIFKEGPINKYLSIDIMIEFIKDHFSKKKDNTLKIWQLLYLNFWIKEFID